MIAVITLVAHVLVLLALMVVMVLVLRFLVLVVIGLGLAVILVVLLMPLVAVIVFVSLPVVVLVFMTLRVAKPAGSDCQGQNRHKNCCSFHRFPPYQFPNQMLAAGQLCRQPCDATWRNCTALVWCKPLQNQELIRARDAFASAAF
jgi:hypothetical protein